MSVAVFLSECHAVDPLREHLQNGMLYVLLLPAIEEALCQARQQIQPLIGLPQQQRAAIGTDRAAIKSPDDFPLPAGFESETRLVTLCPSEGLSLLALTAVWKLSYAIWEALLPMLW